LNRSVGDILPVKPSGEAEISLGKGTAARNSILTNSSLKDWRGQEAGRLLLLHDVTELRRSQAQILEQQRALAMLHERERLGKLEQALAQLHGLIRAAVEVQMDVRGEIRNLSQRLEPVDGFLGSLRHFTTTFQKSNRIAADLALPENLLAVSLPATAEVQLLRIVQEAFANIRKHARAKHVQGILETRSGLHSAQHRRRRRWV
jgi:signal transduction histidine kinase